MLKTLMVPLQLVCQLVKPGQNIEGLNTTIDVPFVYQNTDLPPGFTAFPEIGMAYRYFASSATWNTARENCIAYESSLAVLDSFSKINIAKNLTDKPTFGAWIGVHRLFGDGEWLDVNTGSRLPVIPWGRHDDEDEAKKCLILLAGGQGLASVECNKIGNYFCQIPLLETGR